MKTFSYIVFYIFLIYNFSHADMVVTSNKLPNNIKTFVKQYFPGTIIIYAEMDYNEYKIRINSGAEIEFDINGAWKEVKSFQNFPIEILPKNIIKELKKQFPSARIIKVERIWNGYEIKLSNMTEIFIDNSGKIKKIEYDN